MRSNTGKSSIILLILCVFNQAQSEDTLPVEFSIKPVVCIVKHRGDVCTMTASVHWQVPHLVSPCLYQGTQKTFCWKNRRQAKTNVVINLKENMIFTLKDEQHSLYARQEVVINTSLPTKYRRRLRANWSLF